MCIRPEPLSSSSDKTSNPFIFFPTSPLLTTFLTILPRYQLLDKKKNQLTRESCFFMFRRLQNKVTFFFISFYDFSKISTPYIWRGFTLWVLNQRCEKKLGDGVGRDLNLYGCGDYCLIIWIDLYFTFAKYDFQMFENNWWPYITPNTD